MIDLRQTEIWDARYGLPTVPQHNQPWLYMAYVACCMPFDFMPELVVFARGCDRPDGTSTRWPDGSGGKFSHDEILGRAYFDSPFASRVLDTLMRNDGIYDRNEDMELGNQYRFLFLIPYLKACAKYRVGLFSQLQWCLHVIVTAFSRTEGQESGALKIWLMSEYMNQFQLCKWTYQFFAWKSKTSPGEIFLNHYLKECPTFSKIAPYSF